MGSTLRIRTTGASAVGESALAPEAFVQALQAQLGRYYHKHPFHLLMNAGQLSRAQIQRWAANRFYYLKIIPLKDAAILSNCPDPAIRRIWVKRIIDHDGTEEGQRGIEDWLRLAKAVGLNRQEVFDERHVVPGVRFAADAYVTFARTRSWIEAVEASLTELFAPDLIRDASRLSSVTTPGLTRVA